LPNEPLALVLAGYIDRRQNHWDDSTQELERALELDPRNLFILQQLSFNYGYARRFKEMAAVLDRVVALTPQDVTTRVRRALVEFQWRGDLHPLHDAIESVVAKDAKTVTAISDLWLYLALCKSDGAELPSVRSPSSPPTDVRTRAFLSHELGAKVWSPASAATSPRRAGDLIAHVRK
jgi:hypothetical protein